MLNLLDIKVRDILYSIFSFHPFFVNATIQICGTHYLRLVCLITNKVKLLALGNAKHKAQGIFETIFCCICSRHRLTIFAWNITLSFYKPPLVHSTSSIHCKLHNSAYSNSLLFCLKQFDKLLQKSLSIQLTSIIDNCSKHGKTKHHQFLCEIVLIAFSSTLNYQNGL